MGGRPAGSGRGRAGVKDWPENASTEVADFVYQLGAGTLAHEHADALAEALCRALPWLAGESLAGVLPLTGLSRGDGAHFVGRRSRLVLRLPLSRAAGADALCGTTIDVAGSPLAIGPATRRPLQPVTDVVYSHCVSFDTEDEIDFLERCHDALEARKIKANPVTGKARRLRSGTGTVHGFALMLHGLSPTDSVRIQEQGLGEHRLRGCGMFVPHKTIHAVGE